jgi:signal transduction histidine kinase
MRIDTRKRLAAAGLIALVAIWPLLIAFALRRQQPSGEMAGQIVFFTLLGVISLVFVVQLIRWMQRELTDALEQRTATAEILRVISLSPTDAQPAFETIVKNAVALSGSLFANVFRFDGELLHFVASHNVGPSYVDLLQSKYPLRPDASQVSGRVILTKSIVRLDNVLADPDYDQRFPAAMGWRRMLGVPMLRDGNPIGVIVVGWADPGPVPSAQEELLKTFADQAVIAIENARLFDEVQARTHELSEALQQQTATADVLKVISRSAFDLQIVLNTLTESAARLCDANMAGVTRPDAEGRFYYATNYNLVRPDDWLNLVSPLRFGPERGSVVGRVLATGEVVQIDDVLADPEYTYFAQAKSGGFRTFLGIPLLREGNPIGVLVLGRTEVSPFTRNQIELLKTFADQAVIAIENARLFDEVQARTRELSDALDLQTTTTDVLKVISRSAFDLQAVLDTLAEAAARLCEADAGAIARQKGEAYYQVAHFGAPPAYDDFIRGLPLRAGRGSVVGRVLLEGRAVQIPDVLADNDYAMPEIQEATGFRTLLGVPLLREENPIGVFVLWRRSVSAFTTKQIELLTTFADQAVIAIENARLFDEIQDKSRQLEIANKYKSHFIASASHDLRQPLHALNLFVAQLRGETNPAERDRIVERIDAATASMNELFGALLDMSKLEAGILEPNLTEFPLDRLLKRVETTFAGAARAKGLRLQVLPSSGWARSDFILLERILQNLVSNAVRYTERGGVLVGCRRRGGQLRIDVFDSGPGIAEEQQASIFQEFYQLAAAGPDRRGGLGLGLAIVDRLGRLLDHPVQLRSRPGRGSRFSISVPLADVRHEAREAPDAAAVVADPVQGKLVLVIDDDALVIDGMRGVLQSWGCRVLAADSESAALSQVSAQKPPDLIISDYRLANGKSGIEAIELVRGALGTAPPAFLISGDTAPERLREANDRGYHLLHKPVPPMRLRAMLSQLLRSRQEGGPPAAE